MEIHTKTRVTLRSLLKWVATLEKGQLELLTMSLGKRQRIPQRKLNLGLNSLIWTQIDLTAHLELAIKRRGTKRYMRNILQNQEMTMPSAFRVCTRARGVLLVITYCYVLDPITKHRPSNIDFQKQNDYNVEHIRYLENIVANLRNELRT